MWSGVLGRRGGELGWRAKGTGGVSGVQGTRGGTGREGPERLHQLRRTAAIAQPGQLCPVGHSRIPRNMRLA